MDKRKMLFILILGLFLTIFLSLTNPNDIGLGAILIPFVFFGVIVYLLISLILEKIIRTSSLKRKTKLFNLLATLIIINIVLLNSIGQLNFQDGIIAILITVIGCFYLYKFQIK